MNSRAEILVIVSGGSKGLGESLIKKFLEYDEVEIVSLSRGKSELYENQKISHFVIDLSEKIELEDRFIQLIQNRDKVYFINNAGVVDPVDRIGQLQSDEISSSFNINLVAPIILLNELMKYLNQDNFIVVNISSGAANLEIIGWSIYSTAKKAVLKFLEFLKKEHEITVYNIDPGMLDTGMQKVLRDKTSDEFPEVSRFQGAYMNNELKHPDEVAHSIIKSIME